MIHCQANMTSHQGISICKFKIFFFKIISYYCITFHVKLFNLRLESKFPEAMRNGSLGKVLHNIGQWSRLYN